jgi:RNA-directed DNA polymerase
VRRGDRERRVATALAGAFLAGEWQPAAMGRRAKRSLADRRGWPTGLAEIVVRAYPDRPRDRPRELATFIAACEPFRQALRGPDRAVRVHTWVAAPTEMGRRRWPVPAVDDLAALAAWLGVTPDHLAWFADCRSFERIAADERLRHYRRRWLRKPDGSARLLEAPKRELKDLQRQVLHHILDRLPPHESAHGFRPARSALTATRRHAGHAVVLRYDLESFFSSVTAGRVHGIFRLAGYAEPVAHTLAGLCTTVTPPAVLRAARPATSDTVVERRRRLLAHLATPHLAQGAPTSPALANLSAYGLDRRLAGLARRLGATYTRYADDLVLSGDLGRRASERVGALVAEIASPEGFRVHEAKSRRVGAAQRQTVLGLVVNAHPNVARAEYDRLRAVLHDAARRGPVAADREGHADFRAHLEGRISWVTAANPARGPKLRAALDAIDWG